MKKERDGPEIRVSIARILTQLEKVHLTLWILRMCIDWPFGAPSVVATRSGHLAIWRVDDECPWWISWPRLH